MKRMTDEGGVLVACDKCMGMNCFCKELYDCDTFNNAIYLLSEYESTGLTPDEVRAVLEEVKTAVYTMPYPKDCGHCWMLCKDEDLNEHFCYVQDSLTKRIEDVNSKPDWCPLRCLDAITAEVEV